MSEISKINFSLNSAQSLNKKVIEADENKEKRDRAESPKGDVVAKSVDGEKILDALDIAGKANLAQVKINNINPHDYLDEKRIMDIEKSMGVFEKGVEKHSQALTKEFASIPEFDALSEQDKLAISAKSFVSI